MCSSFLSEIILVTIFISFLDSNFYKLHVDVWYFWKYSLSTKKFLYLTTSAFGILRYNPQRSGHSEALTAAIFFEKSLIDFESQFSISNICFMLQNIFFRSFESPEQFYRTFSNKLLSEAPTQHHPKYLPIFILNAKQMHDFLMFPYYITVCNQI